MEHQKVLITGCHGFVGSNLVDALKRQKEFEVICHDREKYPYQNRKKLKELLYGVNTVVHLAGLVKATNYDLFEANVNSVVNLLESASSQLHFIYASSFAVYKTQNKIITEETPLEPRNFYGFTKKIAEEVILYTCHNPDFSATILRFANIYGKNALNSFVWNMQNKIQQGEEITINGDGNQSRDFVYVDDAVKACILAIKRPQKTSIMNICSGTSHTINEVVAILEAKSMKKARVIYDKSAQETGCWIGSNKKASKELSWKPNIPFSDGIHNL